MLIIMLLAPRLVLTVAFGILFFEKLMYIKCDVPVFMADATFCICLQEKRMKTLIRARERQGRIFRLPKRSSVNGCFWLLLVIHLSWL